MAAKNKPKNKDKKQTQQGSEPSKKTQASETPVDTKDQLLKTQASLPSQPKVEQVPNDININKSNLTLQDLKGETSKNSDLPIEFNIGQSVTQTQKLQANKQQQVEKIQYSVQIPVQQTESKIQSGGVYEAKDQLSIQHTSQPLQVIQESSRENLTSNNVSQEVQKTQHVQSNLNFTQNKGQEVLIQKSKNAQSERNENLIVDSLPVESQYTKDNELEKASQIFQKQNEAEAESLPQRQRDFVSQIQIKAVSQTNLQKFIHKQQEKPLVVPQNLNTESFFSIEGEEERQAQLKQAFLNNNQVIYQSRLQRQETEQNQTEQKSPSNVNIEQNQVTRTKEQPLNKQQVNIDNSVENIQLLQNSVQVEVQLQRQSRPQNEVFNDKICLTESIDVQKLVENQESQLEAQNYISKVQVKPQVVEVRDDSNHLLDINQPIQIVQAVKEEPLLACELQKAPQKAQNQQVTIPHRVDQQNKIFTLVQSQEIPLAETDKYINIEVSTQIAATQINVKQSLSFSDLNFSVERSTGKESISGNYESQRKQQIKENAQVKVEEIIHPVKAIQIHYANISEPIKILEQSMSQPVQVLIQEKLVQAQKNIEVRQAAQVRQELPSEVVSILVQNTSEIPIKSKNIEVILKESEPNSQKSEGQSSPRKRKISEFLTSQQALEQRLKNIDNNLKEEAEKQKQKQKKYQKSLITKILISSSTILAGGIAWGLTKSTQKSLLFSVIGLSAGFLTTKLLK